MKKYLAWIAIFILILLSFGFGFLLRDINADNEINILLKDRKIKTTEIAIATNKNISLTKLLEESKIQQEVLLDEIASLKSKPAQIKYITQIETVVKGEQTIKYQTLPANHTFNLSNGLPVAKFSVKENEYVFNTADLKINADLIIADDSALSLRIESTLDSGTQYPISIDQFTVQHIRERSLWEPNLLIGVAGHCLGGNSLSASTSLNLEVSLIHPSTQLSSMDIDYIGIRAGWSSKQLTLGIDPVLLNLGDRLPVFTNMWIGIGPTINLNGQVGGSLTIGAKL